MNCLKVPPRSPIAVFVITVQKHEFFRVFQFEVLFRPKTVPFWYRLFKCFVKITLGKMLTPEKLIAKFGEPSPSKEGQYMVLWQVPADIRSALPVVPQKIYCNRAIVIPLGAALRSLIVRGLAKELKTWDGCFAVRKSRGLSTWSLHSWGVAIDVNAATNALGAAPTLSAGFVKCFTDAGFDWGGTWTRKDGMHFQLSGIAG